MNKDKEKLEIKPKTIEEFKQIIEKEGNFKCWKCCGLTCIIYRFLPYGHWCGYVGIKKNHKLYGLKYDQKSQVLEKILKKRKRQKVKVKELGLGTLLNILSGKIEATPENVFNVHGGITFSGHLPWWRLSNEWFFGFDTAHAGDLILADIYNLDIDYWLKESGDTYKTKEYAIKETNKLAKQLNKIS